MPEIRRMTQRTGAIAMGVDINTRHVRDRDPRLRTPG